MKRKILIIGAAGNVCLETVKKLADNHDVDIRVGARNPGKAREMHIDGIEIAHFDYCKSETFDDVFRNIDNWMLVSPPAHLKIHDCVKEVIDHAKDAKVKHIVNISSFGIHDDDHPMRIIESHIEECGMDYTFLRPNCYMQYFNTYFRRMIAESNEIRLPAKKAKTSFVDIEDVAECAAKLLTIDHQENKTYQLTGPTALNMVEIANILSEILHRKISYIETTIDHYRLQLELEGWLDNAVEASVELCKYVQQGWNAVVTMGVKDILDRDASSFTDYAIKHKHEWLQTEPVS